jgi:ElaB/YqjD/DUF883 family membrane-anchored ribosome-binding protein
LPESILGDYHRTDCTATNIFQADDPKPARPAMTAEVTTDKLYADLQAVVREAEALLKATAGHAGDKVDEARARAEKSIKQARSRLDDLENHAVRRVKEAASEADEFVRENPWRAIGVAAGVGLLVGLLLSRR